MKQLLFVASLVVAAAAWPAEPDYPQVVPGYEIQLPRDEGSHPQFRTEWWYLTGWLHDEAQRPLGVQITFFRHRPGVGEDNPSSFTARQLLFGHLAVSDPQRGALLREERAAREGFGLVGASQTTLDVRIDDWSLRKEGEKYRASLATSRLSVDLTFEISQPPLLQGERGFSQKGPNASLASYYYSLPQLRAHGSIVLEGKRRQVHGIAWLDHEWSSEFMDERAQGWDWVGLNLHDGAVLMAFRMRDHAQQQHWAAAVRRAAGGGSSEITAFGPSEIDWRPLRRWRSARTGVEYPVEWQVKIGQRSITLQPLMDDQENDARGSTGTLYWEGAVRALDESGREIGRGYLELTGYGARMRL